MKAVILAGGLGTRISEETYIKPKPMVEIGGKPILWHIMKIYSEFNINEFIICCGYKGYAIKEYFANYFLHMSDITFNMKENNMIVHQKKVEPWKVSLIDTGENSMTGGRIKRVREYIGNETFCMTYGDGLANIDVDELISHHKRHNRLATITTVQPPGRYGSIKLGNDFEVAGFQEKPLGDGGWINGGFFVLEPKVLDLIKSDKTDWENEPLITLANNHQLTSYFHKGFWQAMDTLRDRKTLEALWQSNQAPWKTWNDR